MGFNDQVEATTTATSMAGAFGFKQDVNFEIMTKAKEMIKFKILPAFDMNDIIEEDGQKYINPMGWVPCRSSDGNLTDWGCIIKMARFVGRGERKGNFTLFSSFNKNPDAIIEDPYLDLVSRASSDSDWKYLTIYPERDSGDKTPPVLTRPVPCLLVNMINMNNPTKVQIGLFTKSACDSLCSIKQSGLLYQRAVNVTDEQIEADYMAEWAAGDITNPDTGPLLSISKGVDKGNMSNYRIELAFNRETKRVERWAVQPRELLARRYNITDISSIMYEQTAEERVQELVRLINGRSPTGIHEFALLREVFPQYGNLIPEPPVAPSRTTSVGGFGANPATKIQAAPTNNPMAASINRNISRGATGIRKSATSAPAPSIEAVDEPVWAPSDITEQAEGEPVEAREEIATTEIPPMVPGTKIKPMDVAAFLKKCGSSKG